MLMSQGHHVTFMYKSVLIIDNQQILQTFLNKQVHSNCKTRRKIKLWSMAKVWGGTLWAWLQVLKSEEARAPMPPGHRRLCTVPGPWKLSIEWKRMTWGNYETSVKKDVSWFTAVIQRMNVWQLWSWHHDIPRGQNMFSFSLLEFITAVEAKCMTLR